MYTFIRQPSLLLTKTDQVDNLLFVFTSALCAPTRKIHLKHSRIHNFDGLERSVGSALFGRCLNFFDNFIALDDFACKMKHR
jgi:hypothetical protein